MSLRKLLVGVSALSFLLLASVVSFGQIGKITGRVYKNDADGKAQPVAGVKIACYRTDTENKCRSAETDSRGEFIILGVPFGGKFILGVSGPGLEPTFYPETSVGAASEDLVIPVAEGDGREATEEQVRESASVNASGELSEDQKKAAAELEAKRLEILEKNEKAEANNARRERLLKEGEAAFKSKDFDTAIEKFEEGYQMDPEFVGAAPVFLNNLSVSLIERGLAGYKAAAATKLKAEIDAARAKTAADYLQSLSYAMKSIEIGSAETDATTRKANKANSEKWVKEAFRIMGLLNLNLLQYAGTEEDQTKAVTVYKAAFGMMPKDADVLASLVFAYYNAGDTQASLNYAAHYLKTADKSHSQQGAVQDVHDQLTCTGAYKPVKGDPGSACTALTVQPVN